MPMARLMVTAAPIRIGSALGVVCAVMSERLLIPPLLWMDRHARQAEAGRLGRDGQAGAVHLAAFIKARKAPHAVRAFPGGVSALFAALPNRFSVQVRAGRVKLPYGGSA